MSSDKSTGPDVARAHHNAGVKCEKAGDLEGADEQYSLAILRDSKCAPAYLARGTLRWRQRRYKEAAKDLSRAIELDPKEFQAFAVRGSCYLASGIFEGAVNDFSKALQLKPNEPTLLVKRAQAKVKKGDGWGAIDDAQRAIDLEPDNGSAFFAKGLGLERLKDRDGAEEAFRTARDLGNADAMQALVGRYGGL